MQTHVTIYTTASCPYCVRAKALLRARQIEFEEVDVTDAPDKRSWLLAATGRRTVPQIFIGGVPIGGADDLHALDRTGELERRVRRP